MVFLYIFNYTTDIKVSLYFLPSNFTFFFTVKVTVPSAVANNVKSAPCETPSAGQNLLPFCLTIIFPATAFCPPNSLTPSLLALLSLPLLVDH
jgi:hypothetical protein